MESESLGADFRHAVLFLFFLDLFCGPSSLLLVFFTLADVAPFFFLTLLSSLPAVPCILAVFATFSRLAATEVTLPILGW